MVYYLYKNISLKKMINNQTNNNKYLIIEKWLKSLEVIEKIYISFTIILINVILH